MMYNSQLPVFVCVADCGSFNKASEKLFISPPAVMKQINSLEKQFGIKLFDRTKQGIRLTAAGESLYKDAKALIHSSNKAIEKAKNLMIDPEYTLCVATSMLSPCKPFVELWHRVSPAFPQYKLHLVPFDDENEGLLAVAASLGKTSDFAVALGDGDLWQGKCRFLKLGEYARGCAVPMTHRLAGKKALGIEDLYGETLLLCKEGSALGEWEELERNHPQIHLLPISPFYDVEVFNRCVQTGSILASVACWQDIHPSLVTIPLEPAHTVPYGLLYGLEPPQDILQIVAAIRALVE